MFPMEQTLEFVFIAYITPTYITLLHNIQSIMRYHLERQVFYETGISFLYLSPTSHLLISLSFITYSQ